MARRRSTSNATNQQREVDIGSRPVESRVNKESTPITEVKIPRSQAFWTALPWAVACAVTALWPVVVGQHIFYVATACGAMATAIYMYVYDTKIRTMIFGPFVPGVGGFLLWRFYHLVGWKGYVLTVVSGCSVLFWWLFSTASTLTFVQRLGMPMFHQQFHIWKALGNILEWFYTKREPDTQEEPPTRRVSFEVITEGGRVRHHVEPPVDDETFQGVCDVLLGGATFSEANLCGTDKPLPGGENGRVILSELREWMISEGILRWKVKKSNGDAVPTQGVDITAKGAQWMQEALPPHPDEIERS